MMVGLMMYCILINPQGWIYDEYTGSSPSLQHFRYSRYRNLGSYRLSVHTFESLTSEGRSCDIDYDQELEHCYAESGAGHNVSKAMVRKMQ